MAGKESLEAALDLVRQSPVGSGVIDMIVRRPAVGIREVLEKCELTVADGLVGDSWPTRWSGRERDRQQHLAMQITLMNSRVINVIADGDRNRWALAGDQLFVDFDLSKENLPEGTELAVGDAVLAVTAEPHLGCSKFRERFGREAVLFVNSELGRQLNLRGVNARVVRSGVVTTGGVISKSVPFPE